MKYETCWWSYSKQCKNKQCNGCFIYYPTIKGEIKKPDFTKWKSVKVREGLKDFEKFTKVKGSRKKLPYLDKETRKLIMKELRGKKDEKSKQSVRTM